MAAVDWSQLGVDAGLFIAGQVVGVALAVVAFRVVFRYGRRRD